MPARTRFCRLIIIVGTLLGSNAHAGPMSSWSRVRGNWVLWLPLNQNPSGINPETANTYSSQSNVYTTNSYTPIAVPVSSGGFPIAAATAPTSSATYGGSPVYTATVSAPASSAPIATAVSQPTSTPVTAAAAAYDAVINFGTGSFPEASLLTTGPATAWYNSPSVQHVYGGTPSGQQQSDFTNMVLQDVQRTFQLSGLNPKITIDPNTSAVHTLSVVSDASYISNPNAIGITDVNANGFGFIDKLNYASSPQELAWAVAHNVAHELMHAFGVAVHHDQTGQYLDAASATWAMLTNPNTTFSSAAVQDIANNLAQAHASATTVAGAEMLKAIRNTPGNPSALKDNGLELLPPPVPEPATLAGWSTAMVVVAGHRSLRRRRATSAA